MKTNKPKVVLRKDLTIEIGMPISILTYEDENRLIVLIKISSIEFVSIFFIFITIASFPSSSFACIIASFSVSPWNFLIIIIQSPSLLIVIQHLILFRYMKQQSNL